MVLCLVLTALPATLAAQAVKSDQETLIDLERKWNAAFHSGDVKFIESILADEFVATYDDGNRADKKKEVALAGSFNQQIDASALENFDIRIYDKTAVVMFTLHLIGPIQGKPVQMTYRYMDVWILRDGKWLCVASQSTKVGAKELDPGTDR
jgi:ketosteroid isomerase-like protein